MSIDWHALLTVLCATLAATVGLVGLFTLGVVGLARPAGAARPRPATAALTRAASWLCFAACAAATVWGIWLITAK
ncbi:hypothetical protein [Actinacidiphila acididurans]|uniref:Secreted protein n=1 Tax=Actinacidiphila acididurans TaxID=2784346 RepID=A0ABS2TQQ2_9ACTN|nr:hypothetical protein [Actinacidiphila acididurans]MBM9505665.1 hypothetical protein [Actinacidiphila acididurans]